ASVLDPDPGAPGDRHDHGTKRHPRPRLGLLLLLLVPAGVLAVGLARLLPLLLVRLLLVAAWLLLWQSAAGRVLLLLRSTRWVLLLLWTARWVLLTPAPTLLPGVATLLGVSARLLAPLLWVIASIGRAHRAS